MSACQILKEPDTNDDRIPPNRTGYAGSTVHATRLKSAGVGRIPFRHTRYPSQDGPRGSNTVLAHSLAVSGRLAWVVLRRIIRHHRLPASIPSRT